MEDSLQTLLRQAQAGDSQQRRAEFLAFAAVTQSETLRRLCDYILFRSPENGSESTGERTQIGARLRLIPTLMFYCDWTDAIEKLQELHDQAEPQPGSRREQPPETKIGEPRLAPLAAAVCQAIVLGYSPPYHSSEVRRKLVPSIEPQPEIAEPVAPEQASEAGIDNETFERHWKLHEQRLLGVIQRGIPDPQHAPDILQSLATRQLQRLERFPEYTREEVGFLRYLQSCIPGAIVDWRRQQRHLPQTDFESHQPVSDPDFDRESEDRAYHRLEHDLRSQLYQLIKELPAEDQQLVIAHVVDNLKPQDCVQKCFYQVGVVLDRDQASDRTATLIEKIVRQLSREVSRNRTG